MLEEARGAGGILDLMRRSGALLEGHFVLSSGLHSEKYIQCALLLELPTRAEIAGRALARLVEEAVGAAAVDVVVSPALGGVIIGHELARALGGRAVFVERVAGTMSLRRGFSIGKGERVLVVEDVVTTGGSTEEVMRVVSAEGGTVVGVAAIVNRSVDIDFKVPFVSLVRAQIANYESQACPLCKSGTPLARPGSRNTEGGGKTGS
jgi:orotate phosphoribosyltransferase